MKKYLVLSLVCVCAVALGCSKGPKKPADLPALNPTVVTVTYDDGEPVADAQVVLRNPSSTGGRVWNVTGKTDATGKATMMTDGNWPGVPAGDYQGMVIKEISDVEEPTTVGGSALSTRNYWTAVAVFAGTFALSGLGLLIYNSICRRNNLRRSAAQEEAEE